MRGVLFLAESFHPVLGGGERHLRELSRALAASQMPATVITRRSQAGWPRAETLDGVRVLRVGPAGPSRRGKYLMAPGALRAAAREARRHDVLVVRATRVLGLPGLFAARAAGCAAVMQPEVNGELSGEVYTWGTRYDRPWPRRAVREATALRNTLLRDADAFVAMSRAIQREMAEAGVPPEKILYNPHGVDTERFRPATPEERAALRRRLGWPDDALVVIYTGRLLRGKGLEALLDAFAAAAAEEPRARLVLVGSGEGQALSIEDALRERASPLGERVTFTGRLDDVSEPLRAADVFAFPSVFEALGISLLEAAACGLPSVASRTGGIVDVLGDGRGGVLVAPGDTAALADALRALLRDPARRRALGEGARLVACERFDARDSLARYRFLFHELASRRGARPLVTGAAVPPR
ncbi:MAG TPA: glycosyltransferase family 4 protein [Vicinamibacteria bacterium]